LTQRFYSLDVFRGATVALMILVNNPGSWGNIYAPLEHAPWHGCTPTDLVFPFFLFAVGNALSFVMPRLEVAGTPTFLKKVFTRTLLIFAIGLFLNWAPFIRWSNDVLTFRPWEDPVVANKLPTGVRILGVLQRIALSYCFASLIIYFFKIRGAFFASTVLLLGYWVLCVLANPHDPFSLQGYFGIGVDKSILGEAHMYKGEGVSFDPEGLTSTLTSIVQVIFGYFIGNYIQQKGKTYEMLTNLFVVGSIMIFAGFAWDMVFPINKKIWTSSFVVYTTGLAVFTLSIFIFLIEFKKVHEQKWFRPSALQSQILLGLGILAAWPISVITKAPYISVALCILIVEAIILMLLSNNWSKFFDVFGKNPLFIFVLSGFLPRVIGLFRWVDHVNDNGKNVYTSSFSWFWENICKPLSENLKNGSLLYALCMIAFYWSVVYWLDRKKIYIKV
jgi:predicted acyltransferase